MNEKKKLGRMSLGIEKENENRRWCQKKTNTAENKRERYNTV